MRSRIVFLIALLAFGPAASAADLKSDKVVVEFVVGADGRPTKVRVIGAADKKHADAAIAAVQKWQLDKKYAGKKLRQPFEFRLDDSASEPKKK